MKAVADQLRVSVPALYHHVQGRHELVALVADALAEQVLLDERPGQPWRDWLHDAALDLRRMFERAPGLARHARGLGHLTPAILQLHEQACQRLVRSGFAPPQAYLVIRSVADLVESHLERTDTLRTQGTDAAKLLLDAVHERRGAAGTEPLPTLTQALHALGGTAVEDQFDFALRALLAGIPDPPTDRVAGDPQVPDPPA